MTNEELIEMRKLLTKYTEWNLARKQSGFEITHPEPISGLELINFVDRANRVVYDVERQIEVK